jgi:hypothetical protein
MIFKKLDSSHTKTSFAFNLITVINELLMIGFRNLVWGWIIYISTHHVCNIVKSTN